LSTYQLSAPYNNVETAYQNPCTGFRPCHNRTRYTNSKFVFVVLMEIE
jgi:hypothetical protein